MAGTSRLSEVARHVVQPDGIVDSAWWNVEASCRAAGLDFDRWQDGLGALALATGADGLYAADTTVISIARQVGKTFLVGGIAFGLCLRTPNTTVIWTAHRFKTARETFTSMKALCRLPLVSLEVERITNANGEEGIHFRNGSRILFGARENGFGLGFARVGVLVLDEAQRLTEKAMDDLIPTTNAHPNPLILLLGTPPRPTDPGEVFTMLRQEALEGESEGLLYVEISADRDADLDDHEQWRKANPSFPDRTPERSIRRMRKNLSEDSFRREALGIWDETPVHAAVVGSTRWTNLIDAGPADGTRPHGLAVHSSADRHLSVVAAWLIDDVVHLEEVWAGDDADACADWIAKHAGRRTPVAVDNATPSPVAPLLKLRRVKVLGVTTPEFARACGVLADKIRLDRLTRADQPQLVVDVPRRPVGTAGGWVWDLRNDTTGVGHPIVAGTLAIHAASTARTTRTTSASSAGRRSSGRRASA